MNKPRSQIKKEIYDAIKARMEPKNLAASSSIITAPDLEAWLNKQASGCYAKDLSGLDRCAWENGLLKATIRELLNDPDKFSQVEYRKEILGL